MNTKSSKKKKKKNIHRLAHPNHPRPYIISPRGRFLKKRISYNSKVRGGE
jgi:hypothetical protein